MQYTPALLLLLATCGCYASKLNMVYSWHEIDFVFPSEANRNEQIREGRFIPGNSVPIAFDVDMARDRKIISMPRFKPGNAATLAVVTNQKNKRGDHLLAPYPDWSWHRQGDCHGITSVFRSLVDECNRLWVVDTGTIGGSVDVSAGVNRLCPAKLLIFDLTTDKLIKSYAFPTSIIKPETVLTTIAVEVRDTANKCRDTFAYVADVSGFGILVYDSNKEESWRVQSNEMFPHPMWGVFDIAGRQFDLMDGVLALALTPKEPGRERLLHFHSLSGDRENWVSTALLRDKNNFANGANLVARNFYRSPGVREGQAASEAFDENGVLWFSVLPKLSLNCWNSQQDYVPENIIQVDKDAEAYQFIAGLKIKKTKQGVSEVWILSSRFQRHMTGGVDSADVNYRLMKAPIDQLTQGTACHQPKSSGQGVSGGRPSSGGSYGGGRPSGSNSGMSAGYTDGVVYPLDTQPTQRPLHGQKPTKPGAYTG